MCRFALLLACLALSCSEPPLEDAGSMDAAADSIDVVTAPDVPFADVGAEQDVSPCLQNCPRRTDPLQVFVCASGICRQRCLMDPRAAPYLSCTMPYRCVTDYGGAGSVCE